MRKRLRKKKLAQSIANSRSLAAWAREKAKQAGLSMWDRFDLLELAKILEFEVRWHTVWARFK